MNSSTSSRIVSSTSSTARAASSGPKPKSCSRRRCASCSDGVTSTNSQNDGAVSRILPEIGQTSREDHLRRWSTVRQRTSPAYRSEKLDNGTACRRTCPMCVRWNFTEKQTGRKSIGDRPVSTPGFNHTPHGASLSPPLICADESERRSHRCAWCVIALRKVGAVAYVVDLSAALCDLGVVVQRSELYPLRGVHLGGTPEVGLDFRIGA